MCLENEPFRKIVSHIRCFFSVLEAVTWFALSMKVCPPRSPIIILFDFFLVKLDSFRKMDFLLDSFRIKNTVIFSF